MDCYNVQSIYGIKLDTLEIVLYESHNTWMQDGYADDVNGFAFLAGHDDKIIRVFDVKKEKDNLLFKIGDNYSLEIMNLLFISDLKILIV